jgi:hypothetical protein
MSRLAAGAALALCVIAVIALSGWSSRAVSLEERKFALGGSHKARQQKLSGIYGLDYGEESGVEEGMDEAKDDISEAKDMQGTLDDGSNPLRKKLERLIKKVKKFQAKEDKFYGSIDAPAHVDIQVKQGPPGKEGPRGHRCEQEN